jgi:hypothetical protein
MAYDFVTASSQYLSTSSTPVTGYPCTLACWAYKDLAAGGHLITIGSAGSSCFQLLTDNGALVRAGAIDSVGTTGGNAAAGTAATGVWFHAAGTLNSATNRRAWANGVPGGTNSTNITPSGLNRISIGARSRSSVDSYFDGLIAEVGIWNVALTAAEIESLAKGVTCDKVRPQSLRFYAPLIRDLQDVRDGLTITNTNSATVADHPRVYK